MTGFFKKRKKKQTTVRLEPETYEIIEEESDDSGISRSEVIRRLVNLGLRAVAEPETRQKISTV